MSCSTFLNILKILFFKLISKKHHHPRPKISLLIPFSSKNPERRYVLKWLIQYWKSELPEAEIVIGRCRDRIFCKGKALNDAVKRSSGEVLVILDSDAYLPGRIIDRCANRIIEEKHNHLWYVPYRRLYRLTKAATRIILDSDPQNPLRVSSPPPPEWIENQGDRSKYGHRYGAMIMMFPREAFDILGCFDERFRGWGGEDIALLRALDTLYGKHKTTRNDILHLWHPFIGTDYKSRMWEGQDHANINSHLANKYHKASRRPSAMKRIIEESHHHIRNKIW